MSVVAGFLEAVRQKNLSRRGPSAQIAKPIRAGQHHTHMGAPGGLRGNPMVPGGNYGRLIAADEEMRKRKGIMAGGNRELNES